MSLQTRLSALITAIGTDIKALQARTPTILNQVTSVSDASQPSNAVEWWTSIPSLAGKLVTINPIIASVVQNRSELWLRVKSRDGTSAQSLKLLDSDGVSEFQKVAQMAPIRLSTPTNLYSNSYRDYNGGADATWDNPYYWKDTSGVVRLRGLVDRTGLNFAAAQTMFTLPAGYRPFKREMFSVVANAVDWVRIDIQTNGVVSLESWGSRMTNPISFIPLSGIAFRTDA